MRTTLDLDDDVLQAARELAGVQRIIIGRIVSELAGKGLESARLERVRNGVPLLSSRQPGAARVTMKLVNALRDGEA